MQVLSLTVRAQQELTTKDTPERIAWHGGFSERCALPAQIAAKQIATSCSIKLIAPHSLFRAFSRSLFPVCSQYNGSLGDGIFFNPK
jgi:hypothetical protein